MRVRAAAPPQFERHIVGATLLVLIAGVLLFFAGKTRWSKPAIAAVACAASAQGIAWWIRSLALEAGQGHLTAGSGWLWLVTGTALSVAAAAGALFIGAPKKSAKRKR